MKQPLCSSHVLVLVLVCVLGLVCIDVVLQSSMFRIAASCQTTLTLPPTLDVEKLLGKSHPLEENFNVPGRLFTLAQFMCLVFYHHSKLIFLLFLQLHIIPTMSQKEWRTVV